MGKNKGSVSLDGDMAMGQEWSGNHEVGVTKQVAGIGRKTAPNSGPPWDTYIDRDQSDVARSCFNKANKTKKNK